MQNTISKKRTLLVFSLLTLACLLFATLTLTLTLALALTPP